MSKDLFDVLKPIFVLSAIGASSTFVIYKGKFKKTPIVLPILLILYNLFSKGTFIYTRYVTDKENLYKRTNIFRILMILTFTTTLWGSAVICRNRQIQLIKKMHNFVRRYERIYGNKLDYHKLKKVVIYTVCFRFFILVGMMLVTFLSVIYQLIEQKSIMGISVHLLSNFAACTQIITDLQVMNEIFKRLKFEVKNLVTSPLDISLFNRKVRICDNTVIVLKQTCQLHHNLIEITRSFNENYGLLLVLIFLLLFGFVTTGVYHFFNFRELNFLKSIGNICTGVILLIDGVLICHYCQSTMDEANKIGVLIHKLNTENKVLREEIEIFSLQIANEKLVFNAAGFFSVNYSLLFSIFGAITTYIIILIQLSSSE